MSTRGVLLREGASRRRAGVTGPEGAWPRESVLPRLVRVAGESMLPTVRPGDLLLQMPVAEAPSRLPLGGLVVVDLPDRGLAVKRLTALTDDGLWVERDNPRGGVDSWCLGALPPRALRGIVLARVWPRPTWLGTSLLRCATMQRKDHRPGPPAS